MVNQLIDLVLKNRKGLVFILILITTCSIFFITRIKINLDPESFYFPSNDKDRIYYDEFKKKLKAYDNFIDIGITDSKGVLKKEFLNKAFLLVKSIEKIENVEAVISIFPPEKSLNTIATRNGKENIILNKDFIDFTSYVYGKLISDNSKSILIKVAHKSNLTKSESKQLYHYINKAINNINFEKINIIGKVVKEEEMLQLLKDDVILFSSIGFFITLLTMILIFGKIEGLLIGFLGVSMGFLWLIGCYGIFGVSMNIMSPLLPILILIIGVSDVIHIMTKYARESSIKISNNVAIKKTINEVGKTTLITSMTTSIGFISLFVSQIESIRQFGFFVSLGVMLVFLSVILTSIILFSYFPYNLVANWHINYKSKISITKRFLVFIVKRRRILITLFTLSILFLFIPGILSLNTNAYLIDDIPKNSKIYKDYQFFEEHFSGTRLLEISIHPISNSTINDLNILEEIEKLENFLATFPYFKSIFSPNTIFKVANSKINKENIYSLPDENIISILNGELQKSEFWNLINIVVSNDFGTGRLIINMNDVGSKEMEKINKNIYTWIDKNINSNYVNFRLTGSNLLIDKSNEYLLRDLISSLTLALILISFLMSFYFKDVKMSIISLIPNIFPLLMLCSLMGYFEITLKASTSIIFVIAFGIIVDDTIHFLSKFKSEYEKNGNYIKSLHDTLMETGKAVFITSIIFFAGSLSLCFSEFQLTRNLGIMLSTTFACALIADLFLLPLCISLIFSKKGISQDLEAEYNNEYY